MAMSALVFAVPMFFMFLVMPTGMEGGGKPSEVPPAWIILFFPLAYLVMGYLMTAIGCWFYNFMFKYIGGFEYEAGGNDA